MDRLPCELLLLISNYVDIKSIMCVKKVNWALHLKIKAIEKHILLNGLRESPIQDLKTIKSFIYYTRFSDLSWNCYVDSTVKTLYHAIFVTGNYSDIDMFVFYHLYKLATPYTTEGADVSLIFSNEYFINFLYAMTRQGISNCIDLTCYNYYNFILDTNVVLTFDSLHKISQRVVNLNVINKLFACKLLDLSRTILVPCCDTCVRGVISKLAYIKYNSSKDDLICHNYKELKAFFARTNPLLNRLLCTQELVCINRDLLVTHPVNKKRVRLNSRRGKRMLHQLKHLFPYSLHLHDLEKNIKNQQIHLRNKYYSN